MTPRPFVASLETEVPVSRSAQHIQTLVEKFGALEFGLQYDPVTRRPVAVSFRVQDPHLVGADAAPLPVALRAPSGTIYGMIRDRQPNWSRDRVQDQADRVAWRNLHDFVRASLIAVQTGIMTLGEAFMANLVVTLPSGESKRLGELASEGTLLTAGAGGQLLLGAGR